VGGTDTIAQDNCTRNYMYGASKHPHACAGSAGPVERLLLLAPRGAASWAGWSVHRPTGTAKARWWPGWCCTAPDPIVRRAIRSVHRPVRPRISDRSRCPTTNWLDRSVLRPRTRWIGRFSDHRPACSRPACSRSARAEDQMLPWAWADQCSSCSVATRSTTASNSSQSCTSTTPGIGSFQGCTIRHTVASGRPALISSS